MILVDKSAWFASVVEDDVDHADASKKVVANQSRGAKFIIELPV